MIYRDRPAMSASMPDCEAGPYATTITEWSGTESSMLFVEGGWRPARPKSAALQRSWCNASKRVPIVRDGRAPRLPLAKALIADWLHEARVASCCCVKPVESKS